MERESAQRSVRGGSVRTAFITLTSAQVKTLRATPQTIVPSKSGNIIEFISMRLALDYGGTNGFTESTANLAVKYTDGSGAQVSQDIESTGFIDQTADTVTNALPKIDAIVTAAGSVGKALVLHNLGAGEIAGNAAGNNLLKLVVHFRYVESRL